MGGRDLRIYLCYMSKRKEMEKLMKEKVEAALEKVRPGLHADGGDVKLIEVKDNGEVIISLTGACGSCPMSSMTLRLGVERILRKEVPEMTKLVAV